MASTVKRVGPYIVVGWPNYSNQWGGNVNGLGKVCIYDGTTGDFLNSTVGYNQGELFGQQIEEIKDSQNPNRYLIAVAAPRRWSARLNLTVGGVDIFDIQDILSNGFFATPITSIQGFERRTSAMPGFENQICDNNELGTALANAGDLNNDGIEDLIVTDPNYRCGNTNFGFGYRGVLFVFDTRRVGSADIVFSFRNELPLGYNSGVNSLRVGHSATTFKTANRTIAIVSGSNLVISGRWYSGTLIVGVKENGATRLTIKGRLGRSVVNQYREGWTLTNVGDVNGDGIDDIASGNPAPGTPNSRVEFFSGAAIMGATSTTVVPPFSNFYTNTPNSLLGYGVNSVIGISDMDGDGKNEVALGAMGDSLVHIVRP
jgi:hypothetical protein